MKCGLNNTHSMSEFCLHVWNSIRLNETVEECFPKCMENISTITVIFCIINAVIGETPFSIWDTSPKVATFLYSYPTFKIDWIITSSWPLYFGTGKIDAHSCGQNLCNYLHL